MTRYERLMATLDGKPVDRPAVCFYEINGLDEDPANSDAFNIFNHPSWKPLIDLARDHSERIVMRPAAMDNAPPDPAGEFTETETWQDGASRLTRTRIRTPGGRVLTSATRRDPDVNTVWTIEHLLSDVDDVRAFLTLPEAEFGGTAHAASVNAAEAELGDTGVVMLDTPDPLCLAAASFDLGAYTVIAMTERDLFRRLLDRFAKVIQPRVEAVSQALPGRLWRIYGPEYASPPYLPPYLFDEYVVAYVKPMVEAIHAHGGYARIHSHGRLRDILDKIAATGCVALDPIEPPPQGDVELRYVRERYGDQLVLFGNLEISDIENMPPPRFRNVVDRAIEQGTAGSGRGFVLMPSACPYGRVLSPRALENYRTMVAAVAAN